ncbi:MAG: hypothetical protein ACM3JG_09955 [Thiohalocapsa sp.]
MSVEAPPVDSGMDSGHDERLRRMRARNRALLAVLLGLVVLFYVIAIVRMSGG